MERRAEARKRRKGSRGKMEGMFFISQSDSELNNTLYRKSEMWRHRSCGTYLGRRLVRWRAGLRGWKGQRKESSILEKMVCASNCFMRHTLIRHQTDTPPSYIDSLYDDLEDASNGRSVLTRLTPVESGWLARFIRDKIEKDRERAGDEIEQELKVIMFTYASSSGINGLSLEYMSEARSS
jgi:hypothetical protein